MEILKWKHRLGIKIMYSIAMFLLDDCSDDTKKRFEQIFTEIQVTGKKQTFGAE